MLKFNDSVNGTFSKEHTVYFIHRNKAHGTIIQTDDILIPLRFHYSFTNRKRMYLMGHILTEEECAHLFAPLLKERHLTADAISGYSKTSSTMNDEFIPYWGLGHSLVLIN